MIEFDCRCACAAGLWTTIRQSIAGSHHGEYTDGPIGRAILLLAIPMVLELVLESVFAVVDVFFVSRLGADAVATVGLTESMLTIVYAVAIGLSVGATATVARRIGERDPDGAARAAVQAIALGLFVAVPLGLAGFWFARPLLALMGATPDVLAHSSFAAIVLGFNGVIMMLFLINAVFRGAGDAAVAMRVLWIANAINICLDPCFIFGLGPFPELGRDRRGRGDDDRARHRRARAALHAVARRRPHRHPPRAPAARPAGHAEHAAPVGHGRVPDADRDLELGLADSHPGVFGSVAVAGCTIAIRIVMFALLPSWGLSNAAATLVGQNLGAGKPERAEASVWRATIYNVVFLGVVGVVFVDVRRRHRRRVHERSGGRADRRSRPAHHQRRLPVLRRRLRADQSFNGAGDTVTPTLINIAVPLARRDSRSPTCWPARPASARPECSGPLPSRSRRCRWSARRCSAAAAGS